LIIIIHSLKKLWGKKKLSISLALPHDNQPSSRGSCYLPYLARCCCSTSHPIPPQCCQQPPGSPPLHHITLKPSYFVQSRGEIWISTSCIFVFCNYFNYDSCLYDQNKFYYVIFLSSLEPFEIMSWALTWSSDLE